MQGPYRAACQRALWGCGGWSAPIRVSPEWRRSLASSASPAAQLPSAIYHGRIESGRLRADSFQESIVRRLDKLHAQLQHYTPQPVQLPQLGNQDGDKSVWARIKGSFSHKQGDGWDNATRPPGAPKGVYLHGDVGCGKTMLMDLFYDSLEGLPLTRRRVHFHSFMMGVHKRIHALQTEWGNDRLIIPRVAAEIAQDSQVLCFDEFQVVDIVDAMILRRLMSSLIAHGVVLFATSNRAPHDLYYNGIQRENFIPCIKLLESELHVINLDSRTDYRRDRKPLSQTYFTPLNDASREAVAQWYEQLGDFAADPPKPVRLEVWGRPIYVSSASGAAAKLSFEELCGRPLSASDYLELCHRFTAFIVTDVPHLQSEDADRLRRFITFVDSCYEAHGVLIMSMAVPLQKLFVATSGEQTENEFAYHRTLSRLTQMATVDWVEARR